MTVVYQWQSGFLPFARANRCQAPPLRERQREERRGPRASSSGGLLLIKTRSSSPVPVSSQIRCKISWRGALFRKRDRMRGAHQGGDMPDSIQPDHSLNLEEDMQAPPTSEDRPQVVGQSAASPDDAESPPLPPPEPRPKFLGSDGEGRPSSRITSRIRRPWRQSDGGRNNR
jgi:hypothetical protein